MHSKLARRQSLRREHSKRQQQQQQEQERQQQQQHHQLGAVVNTVKSYARDSKHEINVHLGRVPKTEAPTNRKERSERRGRRKSDFSRQQEHRSSRLSAIQNQWESHRKLKEDDEVEVRSQGGSYFSRYFGDCCGLSLCCAW